jgi:glycosyltransferase involved in cell wall biosynthesis
VKILRICYEYPYPWNGLTPGPFEITRHQIDAGHEVVYFCGGSKKVNIYPLSDKLKVKRFGKSLPLIGPFISSLKILHYMKKYNYFDKFDIIHGHGHLPFFLHIYLYFFKKYRHKYILHLHITSKGRTSKLKFKFNFKYITSYLLNWKIHQLSDFLGVKVAGNVICCSNSVKNEAKTIHNRKYYVVENGVNTKMFKTRVNQSWNKFLYVGEISARKRINHIISYLNQYVIEYNTRIEFTIVGTGKLKLNDSISNNLIIKNMGYLDYIDLPQIYSEQDVLLLFSSYEGLPKVVLEALASGLEVISTRSFEFQYSDRIHWIELNYNDLKRVLNNKDIINLGSNSNLSWESKVKQINKIYEYSINS